MRTSEIIRKTGETDIELTFNLDGFGNSELDTGVGFLEHMLTLFAHQEPQVHMFLGRHQDRRA